MTLLQAPDDRSGCIPTLLFRWVAITYRLAQLQANVKAKFQYQRTTFPQVSGDGSAYVTSVGGHAKLGIRVANDGVGHPLVRLDIPMTTRPCLSRHTRDLWCMQDCYPELLDTLYHTLLISLESAAVCPLASPGVAT